MADWQRLSVRDGRKAPVELSASFNPPATVALVHWLEGSFGYRDSFGGIRDKLIIDVALAVETAVNPRNYQVPPMRQLLNQVEQDDELMLDVLDAVLHLGNLHASTVAELKAVLKQAFSIWTVADINTALERRVTDGLHDAYRGAISANDEIALDLQEAWTQVYGLTPNPSDAWDHAIKALESALVPLVAPKNRRATLGTVITELQREPEGVHFDLGTTPDLARTLRFAWPNPDRHGGSEQRTPSEREAAAVVHLAITVVEWQRRGVIHSSGSCCARHWESVPQKDSLVDP